MATKPIAQSGEVSDLHKQIPTRQAAIGLALLVTFLWSTSWVLIRFGRKIMSLQCSPLGLRSASRLLPDRSHYRGNPRSGSAFTAAAFRLGAMRTPTFAPVACAQTLIESCCPPPGHSQDRSGRDPAGRLIVPHLAYIEGDPQSRRSP